MAWGGGWGLQIVGGEAQGSAKGLLWRKWGDVKAFPLHHPMAHYPLLVPTCRESGRGAVTDRT